ncbi:hypothetical protein [Effusibacillus consociatus]|uniref:Uncharacterized protein n=1 Tax=Effusibacillus consociatus TaxID=1117041 RepID=A0ABV9Q2N0_9BACL
MQLFGWIDFYYGLGKTKEIGGCIEAASIVLTNGISYRNCVITRVDYIGNRIYSFGFMDEDGTVRVANVDQVSLVVNPEHKKIRDANNLFYKKWPCEQKQSRLLRLLEISKEASRSSLEKQVDSILDDLGIDQLQNFSWP